MISCIFSGPIQGLIQKEKVDIDWAKGAQTSMLANKIATQWCPNTIIKESKKNYTLYLFFIFSSLCSYYVTDLIKKLELHITVVFLFWLRLSLGTSKLVCPKSVYPCRKQPVSTPATFISKMLPIVQNWIRHFFMNK